jgi:hypothetical protein
MANTTNFGWETPDDTDLVKDGAAAMRTLGNSIDASFVDLKGGTTGQVLAKASNTNLDFTWAAPGLSNPLTTTGDIIYSSSGSTAARLGIGTAGQVLKVNSGATAPEWGAASSEKTYTLINTGGTALTGATTVTVSGLGGYSQFFVLVNSASSANASSQISVRPNGATTGAQVNVSVEVASTYSIGNFSSGSSSTTGTINIGRMGTAAAQVVNGSVHIFGGSTTGLKGYVAHGAGRFESGSNDQTMQWFQGLINPGAEITSISIVSSTGNFDAGTVFIYGAV